MLSSLVVVLGCGERAGARASGWGGGREAGGVGGGRRAAGDPGGGRVGGARRCSAPIMLWGWCGTGGAGDGAAGRPWTGAREAGGERRQVTDIPQVRPVVAEHQAVELEWGGCG